jgi:hypothetical protein
MQCSLKLQRSKRHMVTIMKSEKRFQYCNIHVLLILVNVLATVLNVFSDELTGI